MSQMSNVKFGHTIDNRLIECKKSSTMQLAQKQCTLSPKPGVKTRQEWDCLVPRRPKKQRQLCSTASSQLSRAHLLINEQMNKHTINGDPQTLFPSDFFAFWRSLRKNIRSIIKLINKQLNECVIVPRQTLFPQWVSCPFGGASTNNSNTSTNKQANK